jgi:hypothetical protein
MMALNKLIVLQKEKYIIGDQSKQYSEIEKNTREIDFMDQVEYVVRICGGYGTIK